MSFLRTAVALRNARLDAIRNAIDAGATGGLIEIRTGAAPAAVEDADAGTILGTLTYSATSAPNAAAGLLTFSAITQDAAADATGTAEHARITDSNGVPVFDCSVTATGGGGVIELNTVSIVTGGPISITSFELSTP